MGRSLGRSWLAAIFGINRSTLYFSSMLGSPFPGSVVASGATSRCGVNGGEAGAMDGEGGAFPAAKGRDEGEANTPHWTKCRNSGAGGRRLTH